MSILFLFYLFCENPDPKNLEPVESQLAEEYKKFQEQIQQDSKDFKETPPIIDISQPIYPTYK